MGLKIDKNNTGITFLEAGEYEVYPVAYDATTAKSSGNNMAVVNYLVRDDVDQAGKGQEIRFDNFVETDAALWRMNQAAVAAKMDEDKEYDSIHDWAADFMGRPIRVTVKMNDRGYPEVTNIKESLAGGFMSPEKMKEYKDKKKGNSGVSTTNNAPKQNDPFANQASEAPIDIKDDDLPF